MSAIAEETNAAASAGLTSGAVVSARSILALARREGVRLIRHPTFLAGVLLTAVALVVIMGPATEGSAPVMHRDVAGTGILFFPLAGMTLIAANLAVLRSRRHGSEELFEATPATPAGRTIAHLVSLVWAFGIAVVLAVAWVVYWKASGSVGSLDVFELATGPVLVAGGGAVGVLIGRLVPASLLAPVVVIAVGAIEAGFVSFQPEANPARWWAPWVPPVGEAADLWVRPSGLHVAYLLAIIATLGACAVLRHSRGRSVLMTAGLSVAVAAGAGWSQTRPIPEERIASIARFVEAPESAQICEQALARYCAYPAYEEWIEDWSEPVEAVLGAVPPALAARGLEIRQWVPPGELRKLPAEVKSDLTPATLSATTWPDDGAIHPELRWGHGESGLHIALSAASWAVDLPLTPQESVYTQSQVETIGRLDDAGVETGEHFNGRPGDAYQAMCYSGGQARAVVALWLAAQSSPEARAAMSSGLPGAFGEDDPDDGVRALWAGDSPINGIVSFTPESWVMDFPTGVTWARSDVLYAIQLAERPRQEVRRLVTSNWQRLTAPSTPTSAAVDIFGLRSVRKTSIVPGAMLAYGLRIEDVAGEPCD